MKIAISAILSVAIVALIVTVAFSNRSDENKAAATPSGLKLQQQELSVDQRLDDMLSEKTATDVNFLAVIDRMNELDEELVKIESEQGASLTEAQVAKITQIRIRNKSVVVMMMVRNKVQCAAEKKDLTDYCSLHLNSADEQIQETAKFWLCVIPTLELLESPSDQTLAEFSKVIAQHQDGYINSPEHAATLSGLLFKMSKESPRAKKFWKAGFRSLREQLSMSKIKPIQTIGEQLEGLELFGEFDLPTLAHRILWSDPSAAEDLDGALKVLADNIQTDSKNWVTIAKAYEGYLSTDKIEETGAAWQRMSDLAANINDAEKRASIESILDRQRKRAMAIGSQFDLTGTVLPSGEALEMAKQGYTAVVFCDKSKASMSALAVLGQNSKQNQLRFRPVLAFEKPLRQVDLDSLHSIPKSISVLDYESAKRYYSSFPVDFFPYVLLVDSEGKIVSVNLDIEQVPNRIAKFVAQEREARAARNATEAEATLLQ